MPRQQGTGKGATMPISVRLDDETKAFYRARANEHGIPVSEYLRQLLVQGIIAETVSEIDYRLKATVAELLGKTDRAVGGGFQRSALLSLYTTEELIKSIVEARDPQELYRAQDKARLRVENELGGSDG